MFLKHSIISSGYAQGDTKVKEMEKMPFPPDRNAEQGSIRLEIQTTRHRLSFKFAIPELTEKRAASQCDGAARRGRGTWDIGSGERVGMAVTCSLGSEAPRRQAQASLQKTRVLAWGRNFGLSLTETRGKNTPFPE